MEPSEPAPSGTTKLSVPMQADQRVKITEAAAKEARKLGLSRLSDAEWARMVLFREAGIVL
jgi:hypothetical protein